MSGNFKIGVGVESGGPAGVSGSVEVGVNGPFFVVAGPCVIEGKDICMKIAESLKEIGESEGIGVIFKASFDKANRSSVRSFRGPGIDEGLKVLEAVRREYQMPVLTDVHEPGQAEVAAQVVDCLQVPAFLCRQTDLLSACAHTGRCVNVKKGQFLSPGEMKNVVEKLRAFGNDKILLTERGTFFGYNRLVNDMSGIAEMKAFGLPVVFDATHSAQRPGGLGGVSGGERAVGPVLAKAASAAGANGLYAEVHPRPKEARSDAAVIMPVDWLGDLVRVCKEIFRVAGWSE